MTGELADADKVAPLAGARIKIGYHNLGLDSKEVAPLAGARIKMISGISPASGILGRSRRIFLDGNERFFLLNQMIEKHLNGNTCCEDDFSSGKENHSDAKKRSAEMKRCTETKNERQRGERIRMKTLFLIGGPMGVGKTTVCQILKRKLPNCVFLDGDWCWDMHPFSMTPETKEMVLENIRFLLGQFLRCSAFENIVFCWVMHEQEIIDAILDGLELSGYHVRVISLICEEEELRKRLQKDVDAGLREETVLERSVARIGLYEKLGTEKIDVSGLTPERTAEKILTDAGKRGQGERNGIEKRTRNL